MNELKNARPGTRLLAWALTAVAATALSACGGGDGLAEEPVAAVDRSWTQATHSYCDIDEPLRSGAGIQAALSLQWRYTWDGIVSGSSTTDMATSLYAWGLNDVPVYTNGRALRVDAADHRASDDVVASAGLGSDYAGMGVTIPDAFGDQAVACVKSVSAVVRTYTFNAVGQVVYSTSLVWAGQFGPIPMGTLPGHAVEGFEFASNFMPLTGTVDFTYRTAAIADPSKLAICFISTESNGWDCKTPTLTPVADAFGEYHRATRSGVKPGVYMLVSSNEGYGQ